MGEIQHSLAYRRDVDGLRAIAVLSVLLYHVNPNWLPGGFTGVDVFFVISGFLITKIVSRDIVLGNFSFLRFYQRRILRLYPALLFTIIFSFAVGWFLLYANEMTHLAEHAKFSLLYWINFKLHKESGYFDTSSDFKPLLHLWSLSIEEQFYLLLPMMLIFFSKRRSHLIVSMLILSISFSYNMYLSISQSAFPFFLSPARFWQISAGSIVGLSSDSALKYLCLNPNFFSTLGMTTVFVGMLVTKESNMNPSILALLPVLGTCLVLISGSKPNWIAEKLLSNRLLVGIGLISYPLYLLHWPLLAFLRIVFPMTRPIWMDVIVGFFSISFAYAIYQFIEKPIRGDQKNPSRNAWMLFSLSIIAILFSQLIIHNEGFKERSINLSIAETQSKMVRMLHRSDECLAEIGKDSKIDYCLISRENGQSPQIALIGDSHAHAIYPGFAKYFVKRGMGIILLSNSSCPMLLNVDTEETSEIQKDCEIKKNEILRYLAGSKSIHTVIIANRGYSYISRSGFGPAEPKPLRGVRSRFDSTKTFTPAELFAYGMNHLVAQLTQQKLRSFYFMQVPEVGLGPDLCQMRLSGLSMFDSNCSQSLNEVVTRHEVYRNAINNIVGLAGTFDPLPEICPEQWCSYKLNGEIIYADDDHLNPPGAEMVIDIISYKLDKYFEKEDSD